MQVLEALDFVGKKQDIYTTRVIYKDSLFLD
jgi:hypothetical protein